MDSDRIKGHWKQFTGRVKEQWGVVIDDSDLEREGHMEYLAGKIQNKTGESKDAIREKLRKIENSL